MTQTIEEVPKDEHCEWQDKENNCWLEMPDSKLKCKGKCAYYKFNVTYIGQKQ